MRASLLPPVAVALAAIALGGCKNSCQQLCDEMADYWEECGNAPSKDDIKACYDSHKRKDMTVETRETCQEEADNLREEWTCEDLEPYFGAADDGGGEDTAG